MDELRQRVTRLEVEVADLKGDVTEIKQAVSQTATRNDLTDLRDFFADRDRDYTRNLWKLTFGLVALVAIVAAVSFGLKVGDVAGLWLP